MAGMTAQDKKFEAESDARTLVDAAKLKQDKPRFKTAMAEVRKQRKALSEVTEDDDS